MSGSDTSAIGSVRIRSDGRARSTVVEVRGEDGSWVRMSGLKRLAVEVRPDKTFVLVRLDVEDVALDASGFREFSSRPPERGWRQHLPDVLFGAGVAVLSGLIGAGITVVSLLSFVR